MGEGRVSATDNDAGTAAWTNEGLSSHLVCVVEGPEDAASATKGAIDIGMLAIETSTGHILHAQFRWRPAYPLSRASDHGRSLCSPLCTCGDHRPFKRVVPLPRCPMRLLDAGIASG